MEGHICSNKPNIRTKCSQNGLTVRRRSSQVSSIVSWSSLLFLGTVTLFALPQLVVSSPAAAVDGGAGVLRIDEASAHIYIRLPATSSSIKSDAPKLSGDDVAVRPTFSATSCDRQDVLDPLDVVRVSEGVLIVSYMQFESDHGVEENGAFLCLDQGHGFEHLGVGSRFAMTRTHNRVVRQSGFDQVHNEKTKEDVLPTIRIDGFRVESSDKAINYNDDGVPELMSLSTVRFRFFGDGFSNRTVLTITEAVNSYGGSCIHPVPTQFLAIGSTVQAHTMVVEMVMPLGLSTFYFCTKNMEATESNRNLLNGTIPFMHQGRDGWLIINTYESIIPTWAAIVIIFTCLMFSALFSGLNLGLMSLDRTELKILKSTGTGKEREYAAIIQPIRDHGNYLLCSILLGNVMVNSTFTIILDSLTSGLIAVVFSTLLIVVFGEITPQAVCSRHGLAVGAKTIWITKAVMVLTFPLAYPTSLFLDWVLGEEIGAVYNRERLKELVRVTNDVNDLDKDEVNIISGALELRKKTVADVMTHIEDAFMLSYDAVLDFETVSEIMKSGFSRIPVYEDDRQNVLTLLFIKDLAFVDPDDNTPLRTLCEFYQNSCHFVFEDVTLDVMFKRFKEGHRGHMAFVHRVNSSGDGDPFYETVGLITLEDVIEELIQAEIVDETDVYTDNRTKVRRSRTKKHDFTIFAERRENHHIRISPQLTLATFQYLTTTVDAFRSDIVSETILRRLLNQDVMHQIKFKGRDKDDPSLVIYQQGKPVDYFVLILEGRVEVTVGRESLIFESGPFTYFGTQALIQNVGVDSPQAIKGSLQSLNMDAILRHTFVPDYSVKAVTEVFYIAIKRTLYLAAKRATLMERAQRSGEPSSNEPIDEEVEKLLYSLDGDDHSITTHTANLNLNTPRTSKSVSHQTSPAEPRHTTAETNGLLPESQRKPNDDESEAPLLPKK